MKIRQGFVSNSSSSSFIVTEERLATTTRTALMMLSIIMEEYENYHQTISENMENAIEYLTNNLEYDQPISFPWAINYHTFIKRNENGDIYVSTCNNHDWHNYFSIGDAEEYEEEYEENGDTKYLELTTMKSY